MYKHESSHQGHVIFSIALFLIGAVFGYGIGMQLERANNAESTVTETTTVKKTTTSTAATTPSTATTSTTATATTAKDATADWKTYTNSFYSFKYPKEFSVDTTSGYDSQTRITLSYPTGGLTRGMYAAVLKNTFDDTIKDLTETRGFSVTADKMIDNQTWKSYTYDHKKDANATNEGNSLSYYIAHNGYTYVISANTNAYNGRTAEQVKSDIETILGTFKFAK